jgi:hypothetical protein
MANYKKWEKNDGQFTLDVGQGQLRLLPYGEGCFVSYTPLGAKDPTEMANMTEGRVTVENGADTIINLSRHFKDTPGLSRNVQGLTGLLTEALEMGDYE